MVRFTTTGATVRDSARQVAPPARRPRLRGAGVPAYRGPRVAASRRRPGRRLASTSRHASRRGDQRLPATPLQAPPPAARQGAALNPGEGANETMGKSTLRRLCIRNGPTGTAIRLSRATCAILRPCHIQGQFIGEPSGLAGSPPMSREFMSRPVLLALVSAILCLARRPERRPVPNAAGASTMSRDRPRRGRAPAPLQRQWRL